MNKITHIDCTLRDGGYYNNWDFSLDFIDDYLHAMDQARVDYVEIGLRTFSREGFKGACAYSTDEFIRSLRLPRHAKFGVMVNASELIAYPNGSLKIGRASCRERVL